MKKKRPGEKWRRSAPRESSIVRAIMNELRARASLVWCRKNHGGVFGVAGVPDIEVVFCPPGRKDAIVVFIEVKRPGEKPTELQLSMMRDLAGAGAYVFVAHSKDEAMEKLVLAGLPPVVNPRRSKSERLGCR